MSNLIQAIIHRVMIQAPIILGLLLSNNIAMAQAGNCYEDNDKDGFGDPNKPFAATIFGCNSGFGGVEPGVDNNLDCNDNDASLNPFTIWYRDLDGDEFSDRINSIVQCAQPPGYIKNPKPGIDCDDTNKFIFPGNPLFKDLDGDFHTESFTDVIQSVCGTLPGYILLHQIIGAETNSAVVDCNDNSPLEFPGQKWYPDIDGDGFMGSATVVQCRRPANHKTLSEFSNQVIDCDDNNAAITPLWYKDSDNDGYTDGNTLLQCEQPSGYKRTVLPGADCNDNNPLEHPNQVWHSDGDNDRHGGNLFSGGISISCLRPPGHFAASELQSINDCNDNNGAVYPGATEICDELDNDCNGTIDDGLPKNEYVKDVDGDGYYPGTPLLRCISPGADYIQLILTPVNVGGQLVIVPNKKPGDCDDNNASLNPDTKWVIDADGDGYHPGTPQAQCISPGEGYIMLTFTPIFAGGQLILVPNKHPGDCDDGDNAIYPGAPELCDSKDNNCNGQTDEGRTTWYRDADTDGYGNPNMSTIACTQPLGYLNNNTDCNDGDKDINPGAPELCDGKDNNCNGLIDDGVTSAIWYLDADDDKYSVGPGVISCSSPGTGYKFTGLVGGDDCNDGDKTINPGAPELCDSKDNNCNGQTDEAGTTTTWYRDADTDGYGNPNMSTSACTQPTGYVNNNTDCNDGDKDIYPGAPELCDSKDNNCNGQTDEGGPATWYRDADTDGYGNPNSPKSACTKPAGYVSNNTDCNDNDKTIYPGAPELCDGKDNNCNGQKDEGGTTWYRDADGDGYGNPNLSKIACTRPAGYVSNNTDCNDNNKYIQAPVMYYIDSDRDGFGSQTKAPVCSVIPPIGYSLVGTDCNDNNSAVNPLAKEICGNGTDDNCNGKIDEGCNTCQNATALTTTDITKSSAKLNWSASVNPVQWQVEYRKSGSSSWKNISVAGSSRSVTISSLSSNQTYNWRIKAKCGFSWTSYSATQAFKTRSSSQTGSRELITKGMAEGAPTLKLYPNPSKGQFVVELHLEDIINANAKIQLIDVTGRTVQVENAALSYGSLQKAINVSPALTKGIYLVRIIVNDKVYKTQVIYEN